MFVKFEINIRYHQIMMYVQEYKRNTLLRGFIILLTCSIIHGSQVGFNPSHYNKVLEGQVLDAKKVPTYSVCVYECMVTTDCQSFNYYMDECLCVFHAENSSTAPQCLFGATGRIRYSDISIWPKVIRYIGLGSLLCSITLSILYKQMKFEKRRVENGDSIVLSTFIEYQYFSLNANKAGI